MPWIPLNNSVTTHATHMNKYLFTMFSSRPAIIQLCLVKHSVSTFKIQQKSLFICYKVVQI